MNANDYFEIFLGLLTRLFFERNKFKDDIFNANRCRWLPPKKYPRGIYRKYLKIDPNIGCNLKIWSKKNLVVS